MLNAWAECYTQAVDLVLVILGLLDIFSAEQKILRWECTLDVSGINEKFNIGIYYSTTDNFFCNFIGPDFHSYSMFPVITVLEHTGIPVQVIHLLKMSFIDGPLVNNNQRNRWSTCTGIPVGSRTVLGKRISLLYHIPFFLEEFGSSTI